MSLSLPLVVVMIAAIIILPVIRTSAATWGIEAIDATTLVSMSEDGVRQLEQRALLDREKRVLAWLAERGQLPGPDGRPTTAQHTAYDGWIEQAMNEHREESADHGD